MPQLPDAGTLAAAAAAQRAAYGDGDLSSWAIMAALGEEGWHPVLGNSLGFFVDGNAAAIALFKDKTLLIAIRGSNGEVYNLDPESGIAWDWFSAAVDPMGYYGRLSAYLGQVLDYAATVNLTDIVLTGHSLGAQAATIFAAEAIQARIDDGPMTADQVSIVLFGSPGAPVSSVEKLSPALTARILSISNTDDLVHDLPELIETAQGMANLARALKLNPTTFAASFLLDQLADLEQTGQTVRVNVLDDNEDYDQPLDGLGEHKSALEYQVWTEIAGFRFHEAWSGYASAHGVQVKALSGTANRPGAIHDNLTVEGGGVITVALRGDDTIRLTDHPSAPAFVAGGLGDDSLTGAAGTDFLDGGSGNDRLAGWAGDDFLAGGTGIDTYSIGPHQGRDTISDDGAAGEADILRIYGDGVIDSLDDLDFTAVGNDLHIEGHDAGGAVVLDITVRNMHEDASRVEKLELYLGDDTDAAASLNLTDAWLGDLAAPGPDDDFSPDGPATNGALPIGGSVQGEIENPADRDWFAVQLTGGQSYAFTLRGADSGGGSLADPFMRVRDAAGASLMANEDIGAGSRDAGLVFTAPASGTYFVSVGGDLVTGGTYTLESELVSSSGGAGLYRTGGAGTDILRGGTGDDGLSGQGGDDTLLGLGGRDVLEGGGGDDDLRGGSGDDYLDPGTGVDRVDGGSGLDFLYLDRRNSSLDLTFSAIAATTAVGTTLADGTRVAGVEIFFFVSGSGDDGLIVDDALTGQNSWSGSDGFDRLIVDLTASDQRVVLDQRNGNYGWLGVGPGTYNGHQMVYPAQLYFDAVEAFTISGGSEDDILYGRYSADALSGNGGSDFLYGDSGDDLLDGGAGNDSLSGAYGDDTLRGGAGDDLVDAGAGVDWIDGGSGLDSVNLDRAAYAGDLVLDMRAAATGGGQTLSDGSYVRNVERISLSTGAGNDSLIVDSGMVSQGPANNGQQNYWYAGAGQDRLVADMSASNERVMLGSYYLGLGAQSYNGYGPVFPNALIFDAVEAFTVSGGSEDDILYGRYGADALSGNGGSDFLYGDSGDDLLDGGAGNDSLSGNAGDDDLRGGSGDDVIDSGAGIDRIDGGAGFDFLYLDRRDASQALTFSAIMAATAAGTTLADGTHIAGIERFAVLTGSGDDRLVVGGGLSGQNTWSGGDGLDHLTADLSATDQTVVLEQRNGAYGWLGLGPGTYNGYNMVYPAQLYFDTVEAFTVSGGSASDYLYGRGAADTLTGNGGADYLYGDGGDDTLDGGAGDDSLSGGGGSDTAIFAGPRSAYVASLDPYGRLTITGPDGTDQLYDIERLRFADGEFTVSQLFTTYVTLTAAANTWTGGAGPEDVSGLAGNDALSGMGGDDTLRGGDGNDALNGGDGDDVLIGGLKDDVMDGGAGFNTASYADATALVKVDLSLHGVQQNTGGGGKDTLSNIAGVIGSAFNDILTAGDSGNLLNGGDGVDTASYAKSSAGVNVRLGLAGAQQTGGSGLDTLISIENVTGSAFADTLEGDGGNNVLDGGLGADTLSYAHAGAAVTVSLLVTTAQATGGAGTDTVKGFENLTGSAFNDTLTGSNAANVLDGGDGADHLHGGAGNDLLDGGTGIDILEGGAGNDTYAIDDLDDVIVEAANGGTDLVRTTLSAYTLAANVEQMLYDGLGDFTGTGSAVANIITGRGGADTLSGLAGADQLFGMAGDDHLLGGADNDTLDGGAGADLMEGGLGNDTYIVDDAGDQIIEAAASGTDVVRTGLAALTLAAEVETLTFTGTGAFAGTGNAGNNTINGGAANDVLLGLAGNDKLLGGAGDDQLDGGAGVDTLTGGLGADLFLFATSAEAKNDTVADFSTADGDRIDLSLIDADIRGAATGDQAFSFIGEAAFSKVAGELRYTVAGTVLTVQADVNGDGKADFTLKFNNLAGLSASDFIL